MQMQNLLVSFFSVSGAFHIKIKSLENKNDTIVHRMFRAYSHIKWTVYEFHVYDRSNRDNSDITQFCYHYAGNVDKGPFG